MERYPKVQKFGLTLPLKSLAEQRFESPSVSSVNEQNLLGFLLDIISKTYLKCGQSVNAQDLKLVTNLFKEELVVFPYLTLKELEKCFNEGYKETYGKYYGLSVKTFIGWIDYYIQNIRNIELNNLKKKKSNNEGISEREKQMYISSGLKKCLDHYESNFTILDGYSTFLYQIFYDDYLPKDKETKNKFYEDAKLALEIEFGSMKSKSRQEFIDIKSSLEHIKKPKSTKVIAKAQEMIVLSFLRKTYKDPILIDRLKSKFRLLDN